MQWEKPSYIDINMNAEIGGYQEDFEEREPLPSDSLQQPALGSGTNTSDAPS